MYANTTPYIRTHTHTPAYTLRRTMSTCLASVTSVAIFAGTLSSSGAQRTDSVVIARVG